MNFHRIEIERRHDLTSEKWAFSLMSGAKIVLDEYTILSRETKKHGWKVVRWYERIDQRRNNIDEKDVPLPDDVVIEVKKLVADELRVVMQYR